MKIFACLIVAACLAACSTASKDNAGATPDTGMPAASAASAVLAPNANLVVQDIPPVPKTLVNEVAQYTDFRGHGFIDWHPTRRAMLVAHRPAGGNTVQLFRLDSPMGELEQLTDFPDPVTVASYEPHEGKYIVFERSTAGNEASQIYRLDVDSKQITLLTDPSERHELQGWLHHRSEVLISSVPLDKTATTGTRATLTQSIALVDPARPTASRRLAVLPGTGWSVGGVSWDDTQIALNRYISATESQVWLLDVASGKRVQLLPAPGGKERAVFLAGAFKRDNSGLFVLSDRDGEFRELMFFRFTGKRLTSITRHIPWDIDAHAITEDGKLIAVRANVDGREELRLFDGRSFKELAPPHLPGGSVTASEFHRQLGELAFSSSGAKGPNQIYSFNPGNGLIQQWTRAYAPPGVDMTRFPDQQIVRWTSFDGRQISALVSHPPQRFTGPRPVLVLIHGGPEAQAQMGFMGRYNYMLNELGVAIIEPNVRGSSGYGKTFLTLDNGVKREDAVRDIGALLDWIATQPQFDAHRVMVSGGSYGGYMSLAVATHYAERIRGAIDVVGISNFVSFLQNTESYRRDLRRVEYGDERDPAMRAFLQGISPLTHANWISKPLFVVQGKNDPRVPFTEAEQIVAKARENHTPVWYLRADNEGHGFARKENADYLFYATILFMQQTLLP